MPDHIHLFLESDPSYSPTTIIKRIKGRLYFRRS
ncbi:MAG: transposase [Microcystis sp. M53598_WE2]|nr:transposase [Microcystis sp. M53598_WE2]MDJ0672369.1 transposase [Microcystis sp. M53598_WE2]